MSGIKKDPSKVEQPFPRTKFTATRCSHMLCQLMAELLTITGDVDEAMEYRFDAKNVELIDEAEETLLKKKTSFFCY